MLRSINVILALALVVLVVFLYQLKYESRQLEKTVTELARKVQKERENIAVLKAELSLLTNPERIDRLANKHLKLQTVKPEQIVTIDWLSTQSKKNKKTAMHLKLKKLDR